MAKKNKAAVLAARRKAARRKAAHKAPAGGVMGGVGAARSAGSRSRNDPGTIARAGAATAGRAARAPRFGAGVAKVDPDIGPAAPKSGGGGK
jgi:hypothetical protein